MVQEAKSFHAPFCLHHAGQLSNRCDFLLGPTDIGSHWNMVLDPPRDFPENVVSFHSQRTHKMDWIVLVVAGLFETGWAIGLKFTDGFTRLWPTLWTGLAMIISLGLLGIAVKTLPVGTAYSVWVGVGAVGTVILGIVLLEEPITAARLISVGLIIIGIIGLKLATPA